MPTTCGFPNCKFRSRYRGFEDNRHFYRVPKKPAILRDKWLEAIGRTEATIVSQLRICSGHFRGGEKREGDIPVADPAVDPPRRIELPPKGVRVSGRGSSRGGNAGHYHQSSGRGAGRGRGSQIPFAFGKEANRYRTSLSMEYTALCKSYKHPLDLPRVASPLQSYYPVSSKFFLPSANLRCSQKTSACKQNVRGRPKFGPPGSTDPKLTFSSFPSTKHIFSTKPQPVWFQGTQIDKSTHDDILKGVPLNINGTLLGTPKHGEQYVDASTKPLPNLSQMMFLWNSLRSLQKTLPATPGSTNIPLLHGSPQLHNIDTRTFNTPFNGGWLDLPLLPSLVPAAGLNASTDPRGYLHGYTKRPTFEDPMCQTKIEAYENMFSEMGLESNTFCAEDCNRNQKLSEAPFNFSPSISSTKQSDHTIVDLKPSAAGKQTASVAIFGGPENADVESIIMDMYKSDKLTINLFHVKNTSYIPNETLNTVVVAIVYDAVIGNCDVLRQLSALELVIIGDPGLSLESNQVAALSFLPGIETKFLSQQIDIDVTADVYFKHILLSGEYLADKESFSNQKFYSLVADSDETPHEDCVSKHGDDGASNHPSLWNLIESQHSLLGTTLGIIGLDHISLLIARRCQVFGLKVLVYDPRLPEGTITSFGLQEENRLDHLLATANIVSVHWDTSSFWVQKKDSVSSPMKNSPVHLLLDAHRLLEVMKADTLLLTQESHPCVDAPALINALKRRKIRHLAINAKLVHQFDQGSAECLLRLPNLHLVKPGSLLTQKSLMKHRKCVAVEALTFLVAKVSYDRVAPSSTKSLSPFEGQGRQHQHFRRSSATGSDRLDAFKRHTSRSLEHEVAETKTNQWSVASDSENYEGRAGMPKTNDTESNSFLVNTLVAGLGMAKVDPSNETPLISPACFWPPPPTISTTPATAFELPSSSTSSTSNTTASAQHPEPSGDSSEEDVKGLLLLDMSHPSSPSGSRVLKIVSSNSL